MIMIKTILMFLKVLAIFLPHYELKQFSKNLKLKPVLIMVGYEHLLSTALVHNVYVPSRPWIQFIQHAYFVQCTLCIVFF